MVEEPVIQSVEVTFVGSPPSAEQMERVSGVGDVQIESRVLRCTVCGSFQPFLEALRGYEVINLTSTTITCQRSG